MERQRAEALRRRLTDTLRYLAFLLSAACSVLLFFLLVVLPQFANVFKDFNAKLDPVLMIFLGISDFLRKDMDSVLVALACVLSVGFLLSRRPAVRAGLIDTVSRLPACRARSWDTAGRVSFVATSASSWRAG